MTEVPLLLDLLRQQGVDIWLENGALHYKARKGQAIEPAVRQICLHKAQLIAYLSLAAPQGFRGLISRGTDGLLLTSFSQEYYAKAYATLTDPRLHHCPLVLRLIGELNVEALQASFEALASRHPVIRTAYCHVDGQLRAQVHTAAPISLQFIDLTNADPISRGSKSRQHFVQALEERFDLARGNLLRIRLIRFSSSEHDLIIVIHHSISDAWSMRTLQAELLTHYQAINQGSLAAVTHLPFQFTDYAYWLRAWVNDEDGKTHLRYWQRRLANVDEPFWLPKDPAPLRDSLSQPRADPGAAPSHVTARLRLAAQRSRTTLPVLIFGAVTAVLQAWSGRSEVFLAVIHAGRSHPQTQCLIGCFIQTLLLKVDLRGAVTFADVLHRTRDAYLEALPHDLVPYLMVREFLRPDGGAPLSEIYVNYVPCLEAPVSLNASHSDPVAALKIERLPWGVPLELLDDSADTKLYLRFEEHPNGSVHWSFQFAAHLFRDSTISAASRSLKRLLEGFSDDPGYKLSQLAADPICPDSFITKSQQSL